MFLFFLLCLVGLVVLPMMNAIRVYQQNERYHEMGISSSDFDEFQAQIGKFLKVLFLSSFLSLRKVQNWRKLAHFIWL